MLLSIATNSRGIFFPAVRTLCSFTKSSSVRLFRSSQTNGLFNTSVRWHNSNMASQRKRRTTLYYVTAVGVLIAGGSYAAVPMYRMFCQSYSYGGTVNTTGHDASKIESMKKINNRLLTIKFNADTAASMQWNFKPLQLEVKVYPGETALAFYTAKNPTDHTVTGISTYNVIPFEAGQYFNKIQCFCFEEQMLNPLEQVDMPVFFYIDPEYADDPLLEDVNTITLSYTFFEAKEGFQLPIPAYAR